MIVTVIEVVVAAGCANEEDARVSLGDATVAGIVFDVVMRTQICVKHIEVAGLLHTLHKAQGIACEHDIFDLVIECRART